MPVYYFDTFNDHTSIDSEGLELSNLDEALRELRRALPMMLSEECSEKKDEAQCRIEVRDTSGNRVLVGTLSMSIERV